MVNSPDKPAPTDSHVEPPDPVAVLRKTQWAALKHARGRADAVVTLLRHLIDDDPDVRTAALEVLELVTHQNSIYSVTAPVALYVAGILSDPRTVPVIKAYPTWRGGSGCLRVILLDFLGGVAEDVGDETVGAAASAGYRMEDDPAVTAVWAARPAMFASVSRYLGDSDAQVRNSAVVAAGHLLDAPELLGHRSALRAPLRDASVTSRDFYQRARAEHTLQSWGTHSAAVVDSGKAGLPPF
ncbi:hypothetical protein [Actinoplanes subglobosus]|uniref:HEAT repeat domain-containing protein n=1 Tax=Actinoplanes subglobosus TaxID=1547892 RepID=A0ABV8J1E5_9ACTN